MQLAYQVFYTRYQVYFYFWRIGPALNVGKFQNIMIRIVVHKTCPKIEVSFYSLTVQCDTLRIVGYTQLVLKTRLSVILLLYLVLQNPATTHLFPVIIASNCLSQKAGITYPKIRKVSDICYKT